MVDLEHQGEDLHQEGEAGSPLEAGVLLEVEVVISKKIKFLLELVSQFWGRNVI